MDEIKDTPGCADRYWLPLDQSETQKEIDKRLGITCDGDTKKENFKTLEFAPEPPHMIEVKARHLKFTVGNKYPIMERKPSTWLDRDQTYSFKTTDDENREIWIDEKYFIPAEVNLRFEKELGGFGSLNDTLGWDGKDYACGWAEDSCDVRKMASEKNVKSLEVADDKFKESCDTLAVLSGLKESDYDGTPYHYPTKAGAGSFHRNYKWPTSKTSHITEGTVKDYGNDLMDNPDKCAAAIDKVFGGNKIADPDEIIAAINRHIPHLALSWEDRFLCVSNAKTKITYMEVQTAYIGLKSLVSANVARRTVGKLVANQLEKLF